MTMLSLIIPALNESQIILRNIGELQSWMADNMPEMDYEIVIVNDGSTDGMGEMLEKESKINKRVRVVHHPVNLGRGRAIRTGMENTSSDYLIMLDADLSYSPEHIKGLLEPLMSGRFDLTLASPYHPDGEVQNVPAFRAWLSRWGNKVLALSFQNKIHTSTCVVRGYTRKLVDHLELINDGKDLHLEVLYKTELLGFNIKEVPARLIWRDRQRGKTPKGQGNFLKNNALFKMRKAIFSHFIFNFFSKPQLLFVGPLLLLTIFIVYGLSTLGISAIDNLIHAPESHSFLHIMRQTLIDGLLTVQLTLGGMLLWLAFIVFLFLASQAKQYAKEQYILSARTNYRMKQIERAMNKG